MTEHATALEGANTLVVYASTHGHTAKIATRVAHAMQSRGLDVDLLEVSTAAGTDPSDFDLVVVAASLHKERHQSEIVDWVKAHRDALEQRPTALVSVSLSAAEDSDEALAATQRCIEAFCADTGWTPGRSERVAGCLQYREYDVFTRQLMRLLMKRMGHPTDASHDYDYTDWAAVDRLGLELADLAAATAGVRA
jgi:menaquinone-dependent protoporphyrinogen oxidase